MVGISRFMVSSAPAVLSKFDILLVKMFSIRQKLNQIPPAAIRP